MPYASKAQQKFFHAAQSRGEISKKTVKEYDRATKGKYQDLPEHVEKKASQFADVLMKLAGKTPCKTCGCTGSHGDYIGSKVRE